MKNADEPIHGRVIQSGTAKIKNGGLSKREYFAAKALQGFLSGPHAEADCGLHGLAHDSVTAADELLKALEKAK